MATKKKPQADFGRRFFTSRGGLNPLADVCTTPTTCIQCDCEHLATVHALCALGQKIDVDTLRG